MDGLARVAADRAIDQGSGDAARAQYDAMIPGDDAKRAFDGWETTRVLYGGWGRDVTDNVHRQRQRWQRALCAVPCNGWEGYRLWKSSDTDEAERPVAWRGHLRAAAAERCTAAAGGSDTVQMCDENNEENTSARAA